MESKGADDVNAEQNRENIRQYENQPILRFDELHSLSREIYEEYFDVMPISQDQKTDRVLIAMALEDRFLEILSLAEIRQKQDKPWLGEIIELFTLGFRSCKSQS